MISVEINIRWERRGRRVGIGERKIEERKREKKVCRLRTTIHRSGYTRGGGMTREGSTREEGEGGLA